MNYAIEHRTLHFKQPAGTSRGVYRTRDVWYVTLTEADRQGLGECAPLPDLSCDALPDYEEFLHAACAMTCQLGHIPHALLADYPSILFGLECAMRQLQPTVTDDPWLTQFLDGRQGIPINGLVWMGSYDEMRQRLEEKLSAGFRCVKLKIGAINFDDELALIKRIRKDYTCERVQLRVDANGAFVTTAGEAIGKLRQLADYGIHSIEQPIRQGHWNEMARLTQEMGETLPIALDEELIGVNKTDAKVRLLDTIRPQYIILKPSLHGGIAGCDEWIRLASERGIGWWATSALESNVGLSAIARWVAAYHPQLPQGLGTGALFTDNTTPHTLVRGDELFWMPS